MPIESFSSLIMQICFSDDFPKWNATHKVEGFGNTGKLNLILTLLLARLVALGELTNIFWALLPAQVKLGF